MPDYHVARDLPKTTDFLVVGGGVVGLSLALEIRRRRPGASVCVIEKEPDVGAHASGRNSGVLHAGFYYSADSLKARLCREGNARMQAWCEEHKVPLRKCGKLVVARNEQERTGLSELKRRGDDNGVSLELISAEDVQRIEPRAQSFGEALFSPSTAAVSPRAVMISLARAAVSRGIELVLDTAWLKRHEQTHTTTRGAIHAGFMVNAAGLHAVKIAQDLGFANDYAMLPFKGHYLYGNDTAGTLAVHVYPVPDLDLPFLGVHFTVTVDGRVKIGPTATPAWWLENYGAVGRSGFFQGFSIGELGSILGQQGRLFIGDPSFRRHAMREPRKSFRRALVSEASSLIDGVKPESFVTWGRPGIRAQLVHRRRSELVMDFCFESGPRSLHVLNAVSPGFTCAFSFAELLADAIDDEPNHRS